MLPTFVRELTDQKAITWATDCKGANADIISMSFGFPEEPSVGGRHPISSAIYNAVAKRDGKIIFFAAAANEGGNKREMFPAQHSEVISIRATDHQGIFQDFNPPLDFQTAPAFGTLGKDVPGAWLNTDDGEVCKTGTSIATSIAAGTAATILGYVQLGLLSERFDNIDLVKKLWTRPGMISALMKFSKEMDTKRFYLYPQDFLKKMNVQDRDARLIDAAGNQ